MKKKFFSVMISAVLLATASENQETTAVTEMTESTEKPAETTIIL